MGATPHIYFFLFGLLIVAAFVSTCMWICEVISVVYQDLLRRWDASRRRLT
jgi:hypothetical protein